MFLLTCWIILLLQIQIWLILIRTHLVLRCISCLPHLLINNICRISLIRIGNHLIIIPPKIGTLNLLTRSISIWSLLISIGHLIPTYFTYLLGVVFVEEVHWSVWTGSLFEVKHVCWLLDRVIDVLDGIWWGFTVLRLSHFVLAGVPLSTAINVVLVLIQAGFGDVSIMNRWVLSVLLRSWIRRTHNSISEKIIIPSCIIHILFSWICICVIRKINIIINIVCHICRLFRLLILRSPLRNLSYVVTVFRIHNSIRVSSLVGVVDLPWLRLIHLSTITLGRWMQSSNTTGPCVCSFLFALGATNIS